MSAETDDNLSIPEALLEAKRLHGAAPSYHVAWSHVVRGELPAERSGNRYVVKRSTVPRLAALARPARPRAV
jgi:hypothetical protein